MTDKNRLDNEKPSFMVDNTREVTRRFRLGVREVLRDHTLSGNPVAVWRDSKVMLLSPETVLAELRGKRGVPKT